MWTEDDLLVSARKKLLTNDQFAALIGTDVGKDAQGAYTDAWVFQTTDDAHTPDRNPRNSGTSAIVLSMDVPWTSPNRHNTLRFPELYVHILSDATRDSDPALSVIQDGRARCRRVGAVIRDIFNDVGNKDHFWPDGVYVISSVLWTDLRVNDVPTEDGLVSGNMSFAIELG